jgi:arylsulfatase A-like enzyme
MIRRDFVGAAVVAAFTVLLSLPLVKGSAEAPPPDFVLIVTDDQRQDSLWAMPVVQSELIGKGINFTQGFVVNPLCCPSRASILTGRYSHTTGVYDNGQFGLAVFDDTDTLATRLWALGYRTGLFGKYMNLYTDPEVPPGWSE